MRSLPRYPEVEPHGPRGLWLLAVTLVVVVPLVGWSLWYAPVRAGEPATCPEGTRTPADESQDGVCLLTLVPGDELTYLLPITSDGPLGVTIAEVAFTADGLLEAVAADLDGDPLPAELGAGQEAVLTVTARMRGCGPVAAGRIYTYQTLPLRQRLGPLSRQERLTLPTPLAIDVGDC